MKSKVTGVHKVQHVLLAATSTWHFSIIQWPVQWPVVIPASPTGSVISLSATTFSHELQEIKEQTDQGWLILFYWSWASKPCELQSPPAVGCALHPATVSVFHLNYSARSCTRDSNSLHVYGCADGAQGQNKMRGMLHNLGQLNTIWLMWGACLWGVGVRPGVLASSKGHYALHSNTERLHECPSSYNWSWLNSLGTFMSIQEARQDKHGGWISYVPDPLYCLVNKQHQENHYLLCIILTDKYCVCKGPIINCLKKR